MKALTVAELIEELQQHPDYYPVRCRSDEVPHTDFTVERVRQHSGYDGAAVVICG